MKIRPRKIGFGKARALDDCVGEICKRELGMIEVRARPARLRPVRLHQCAADKNCLQSACVDKHSLMQRSLAAVGAVERGGRKIGVVGNAANERCCFERAAAEITAAEIRSREIRPREIDARHHRIVKIHFRQIQPSQHDRTQLAHLEPSLRKNSFVERHAVKAGAVKLHGREIRLHQLRAIKLAPLDGRSGKVCG